VLNVQTSLGGVGHLLRCLCAGEGKRTHSKGQGEGCTLRACLIAYIYPAAIGIAHREDRVDDRGHQQGAQRGELRELCHCAKLF
jgi:hypothetical protein